MIPLTYLDWRKCIEQDCRITLTHEFATQRLAIYQDRKNSETQKFVSLYGEQHLKNIILWLQQIG